MNPQAAALAAKLGIKLGEKALEALVQMFNSYQSEATQRAWIRENYATLREIFRLEQEALLRFYELRFAERNASLEHFYWLLHEAVRSGNDLHLQAALFGILDIIKTDPLADYDQFVVAFRDPNVQLEI